VPGSQRSFCVRLMWCAIAIVIAISVSVRARLAGEISPIDAAASDAAPILITANWSQEWPDGEQYIGLFRGHVSISQGNTVLSAEQMVVWVNGGPHSPDGRTRLTVFLEDNVQGQTAHGDISGASHLCELATSGGITLTVKGRQTQLPGHEDALYQRAWQRKQGPRRDQLQPTQYVVSPFDPAYRTVQLDSPQAGRVRRVRLFQRGAMPFSLRSEPVPNTTPPEQIVLVTGGVNLLIDGPPDVSGYQVGTVDLSADRVVIWTTAINDNDYQLEQWQSQDTPYQVYLEGNIVIRQGTNVVRAERAFFDARDNQALVLNAEFKAFVPQIDGAVRVRAESLRMLNQQQYHAQNAWVTTSQFGKPGYRLQASDLFIEPRNTGLFGRPLTTTVDPQTGLPVSETIPWVTAVNTQFLIDDVPVFYLPSVSAPADDLSIPLQTLTFRQDRIFGTQIRTRWNAFQLFGLERPDGTRWNIEADFLSARGPLLGTDGSYRGLDAMGRPFQGQGLATYIRDDGEDNLGLGRRDLAPDQQDRGRLLWRHQHWLNESIRLQAEFSPVFDRNFLEQYYEQEFDRGKDQETLAYVRSHVDNWSWSALVRPQVNWFENNTQWLPRGDLTVLNQPLLNGAVSWSTHTSAGYASLEPARAPSDPNDLFSPLPYYTEADGLVAMTRHELQAPLQLGAVKVAPYVQGEAAFWSDGFTQQSIDRFYGRGGVRASLLAWRVYPYVQSDMFNLSGLAHKMLFDVDAGWAVSSRDLSEIPQWNEFDDDAQERFRERLLVNTFAGTLPAQFDPRFYAVRSQAGQSVTAPYHELVDDQQAIRLGWRHRLQTKVGPLDRQRTKDWMTLDLGVTIFPDANRDNFGETFGLLTSRYAWAVGDRTTLLASTQNDFFADAAQLWNVGVLSQRSARGSLYVGYRQIQGGPLDSQILTASYSYQMSPKWISTASTAYDIGERENRGQALTITRVGEWLLVHVGFNFDASKNNVGAAISVEPRLGNGQISSMLLGPLLNGY
jgi:lipopolysaccharide export system protein LptA